MAVIKTTPNTTGTAGSGNRPSPPTTLTKAPAANRGGVAARPGVRTTQAPPKSSRDFLRDTQSELKKVVWPTREEVRSGTIVTVLLLVVFGAYIFGLDYSISKVFESLLYGGTAPVGR